MRVNSLRANAGRSHLLPLSGLRCPPKPLAASSRRLGSFVKSVFDPPILSVSFDFYLTGLVAPRKNQGHRHRARPLCIGPQVFLMGVRPHYPTTLGLLHTERLSFGGHICFSNFVRTAFSRRLLIGRIRRLHFAVADGPVNGKLFTPDCE